MSVVYLDDQQPGEQRTLAIDITKDVASGVTATTATVSAVRDDVTPPVDVTATILVSPTCTVAHPLVNFTLKSLTNGQRYHLSFIVNLSNGNNIRPDAYISCIEK